MQPVSPEYVAGLVDGEGHITIQRNLNLGKGRKSPRYTPRVSIANTNREALVVVQASYGGCFHVHKPARGRKQSYELTWTSRKAMRFLGQIYPYLLIKKADAHLLMQYAAYVSALQLRPKGTKGMPRLLQADIELRDRFYHSILELHHLALT